MKSFIKTVAENVSVLSGGTITLSTTTPIGYKKCNIALVGNNTIVINDNHTNSYRITINATFTVPATGDVSIDVYANGTIINGATATKTITATTSTENMSYSTIYRVESTCSCNNTQVAITLINSGVACLISNLEVNVEKM